MSFVAKFNVDNDIVIVNKAKFNVDDDAVSIDETILML